MSLIIVLPLVTMLLPTHSWYDLGCCGSNHCYPVACEHLVEDGDGWVYLPTNNHFAREQVLPSHDRQCHVCLSGGRSLCAYVQMST